MLTSLFFLRRRICVPCCLGASLLISALPCHAQSFTTMYKTVGISAFGGYTEVNPGLNSAPDDHGGTIGLDITRYFSIPLAISLEGRATLANGSVENEKSYDYGLKAETGPFFHRVRPYADFLVGFATVHYNCTTTIVAVPVTGNSGGQTTSSSCGIRGDNSAITSIGGGADIDLAGRFSAKADLQYQYWNLGNNQKFNPTLVLVGIVYRIPFSAHNREHVHN
jgi:hypothetical protein